MKKLTRLAKLVSLSLCLTVAACGFEAPDDPAFELADEVAGTADSEPANRPIGETFELSDQITGTAQSSHREFELGDQTAGTVHPAPGLSNGSDAHTCEPGVFMGCKDENTAVYCADNGRSLEIEECANGCNALACSPFER
jgi:hypothetical protein